MKNIKEKTIILNQYRTSFEFYDKVSGKLLVDSEGQPIDIFAKCNLVKLCKGDKEEYKFLYNDPDGSKVLLSFYDRYIIVTKKSSAAGGEIHAALVWTDGVHKSYMSLPIYMTVQNLGFDEQTKSWQFETEIAAAPTPSNSPILLEAPVTDTTKQTLLSGNCDQDDSSL